MTTETATIYVATRYVWKDGNITFGSMREESDREHAELEAIATMVHTQGECQSWDIRRFVEIPF